MEKRVPDTGMWNYYHWLMVIKMVRKVVSPYMYIVCKHQSPE